MSELPDKTVQDGSQDRSASPAKFRLSDMNSRDLSMESPPPLSPSSTTASQRAKSPVSVSRSESPELNMADYVTLDTLRSSRASSRLSPAFERVSPIQAPKSSPSSSSSSSSSSHSPSTSPPPPELRPKSYQTSGNPIPVPKRGVKPFKSTPTPTVVTPIPQQNRLQSTSPYYSEPKQAIYEQTSTPRSSVRSSQNPAQLQSQRQHQQHHHQRAESRIYENQINFNQRQHQMTPTSIGQTAATVQQIKSSKQKKDRRFATALCVFMSVLTFVLVLMFYMVGEQAFKSILMIFTFVTVLSVFLACFYRRPTVIYAPHCPPEMLETIVAGSTPSAAQNGPKNPVLFILPPPVGVNNAKLLQFNGKQRTGTLSVGNQLMESLQTVCPVHKQPVYMNDPNNNVHYGPTPPPIQSIPQSTDWSRNSAYGADRRRYTLNL